MSDNTPSSEDAAGDSSQRPRLFYFNGGFFTQTRVRRILDLAGYDLKLGKPGPDDLIAVWGKSRTSGRGEKVAGHTDAQLVHIEDAFLRSLKPGRDGEPPLGLTIDHRRPYFDSAGPSDLEHLLSREPFDDAHELSRARAAIARIKELNLSKYNDFDDRAPIPNAGYVLVIDQTRGDASIKHGAATADHFREMLAYALEEHPNAPVVIKTHPETQGGHRKGHFTLADAGGRVSLNEHKASPYALMEGAVAVYTVSSGMGFEAILAGHKPVVFGQPFYAGWGLSDDRQPIDRRQRMLTRPQLFAGVMLRYCKWYDPYRNKLCDLEQVIDTLEALTRAQRQDRNGHVALGMRLWKRGPIQQMFGARRFGKDAQVRFVADPDEALKEARGGSLLVWAGQEPEDYALRAESQKIRLLRVEDGFLRSRGLGADLVAPLSLVTDDTGIYYDPTRPSALEALIAGSHSLGDADLLRAERLRRAIVRMRLSKYNLGGAEFDIPSDGQEVILVPGQVEDDASIRLGTKDVATNEGLLAAVRRDFPDAFVVYKPHPDVEAGLRPGAIAAEDADMIAAKADAVALIGKADRVCTMTSLLGFEALLRNVPVTCYGAPFYAGWGLTDDRGPVPARRGPEATLDGLVHATLIGYPRYFDPVTQQPCPVEVVVERLAHGVLPRPSLHNRLLAKAQGALAGYAHLWR
ncbi:capsular polysaccharide biosynthesis protein [Litoreibacter arenae]|uniref:Capsule polysaccharide export protein n=1 Tax=Litoreibacter arenae DSM 19593 TaxID=1123360 RepID=S9QHI1_9RHOB|nr:capsular polysaccharide biosynthesis protein [Litoreibacter arenae]EPX80921.1 Capsule polysaccharide export protein [Litoreibacter arenae DSM 19593]